MRAGTDTTPRLKPRTGSEGATLVWLDSLAGGLCTADAFLAAMRERFEDGEGNRQVLSLIDQYHRRGKLQPELFQTLKSRLDGTAEGAAAPAARPAPVLTTAPVKAPASKPRAATREVAIGDVLRGRYRVTRVLGRGGMGTVFEVRDEYRLELPMAGQCIALKALHPAVTLQDELLCELQREFQHLQSLSHPNIVRVHEFDRDGGVAFFTMELLSGALLSRVLNARGAEPLPRSQALAAIRDIGAALAHAHSRGVVHGDVNPQNIFVTNEGDLRVLDFGAAHHLRPDLEGGGESPRAAVATPGYASCEVLEGERPDARDDVFAFACVAYLLLTGSHPFPARTALEARTRRLHPRRPPGLPGRQWRVLQEGLRWDRERRPSDVQDWLARFDLRDAAPRLPALAMLVEVAPPRRRRASAGIAAAVLLALLAAGGYWIATNYESLAQSVSEWRAAASSKSSAESEPGVAVPQPPALYEPPASSPPPALLQPPALPPPQALAVPLRAAPPPAPAKDVAVAAPAKMVAVAAPAAAAPSSAIGPARIEMAADAVDVPAADNIAHVTVRRRGNAHGAANFAWWTESGTAKPGVDFVPVIPHTERFADGQSSVSLSIPLSDAPRGRPKSFYVVIDQAESGPALGARALTMVTIQPPDSP